MLNLPMAQLNYCSHGFDADTRVHKTLMAGSTAKIAHKVKQTSDAQQGEKNECLKRPVTTVRKCVITPSAD